MISNKLITWYRYLTTENNDLNEVCVAGQVVFFTNIDSITN